MVLGPQSDLKFGARGKNRFFSKNRLFSVFWALKLVWNNFFRAKYNFSIKNSAVFGTKSSFLTFFGVENRIFG